MKYEYTVMPTPPSKKVGLPVWPFWDEWEKSLNKLGGQGWKVIHIGPNCVVFERKVMTEKKT